MVKTKNEMQKDKVHLQRLDRYLSRDFLALHVWLDYAIPVAFPDG